MTRLMRFVFVVLLAVLLRPLSVAAQTVPGFTYTIRVTSGSPDARGISGGPGAMNYLGNASWAGKHGRVDIVEGGVDQLFAKGDYLLVDSTTVTVVHPAKQEYIVVSLNGDSVNARLAAMGATIQLSDEKVTLDSLGLGDTISGVPTKRYRMTVAFNMSMDAGVVQQRLGTESVTDYWLGTVPGLPSNPLLRSNGLSGSAMVGMFKTLSARVDSAAAKMGSALALRTSATTRVVTGPGQVIETHQSSQVSDIKRAGIDQSLLMIPAGYRKVALPN